MDRLEIVNVTCAASVPTSAPTETVFTFIPGIVRKIWIWIPAGHAGLTGIALGYGHSPVIPYVKGGFLSGDDEVFILDWNDRVPGVPWAAFTVNSDLQAHSWQVRMAIDETNVGLTSSVIQPISVSAIEAAANAVPEG